MVEVGYEYELDEVGINEFVSYSIVEEEQIDETIGGYSVESKVWVEVWVFEED